MDYYAFYVARNRCPGPVFIDLPKDLQNQVSDDEAIEPFTNTMSVKKSSFPTKEIEEDRDTDAVRLMQKPRVNRNIQNVIHLGQIHRGIMFDDDKDESTLEAVIMDHLTSENVFYKNGDSVRFESGSRAVAEMIDHISLAENQ